METVTGRLAGRIALVTGASRGLGAATARRLAAEGAQVVLAARTVGALEEVDDSIRAAGGQNAVLVPLDLCRAEQIDQLAGALYQRFGRLDILVGNAATLGILSPVGHIDPRVWDDVFAVNVHANWRLLRGLDPLLRISGSGRAVFVTCAAARERRAYWSAYAASKAALEAMVECYAAETTKQPLRVNLFDPGPMRTALRSQAYPGEDAARLVSPEDAASALADLVAADAATPDLLHRLAAVQA